MERLFDTDYLVAAPFVLNRKPSFVLVYVEIYLPAKDGDDSNRGTSSSWSLTSMIPRLRLRRIELLRPCREYVTLTRVEASTRFDCPAKGLITEFSIQDLIRSVFSDIFRETVSCVTSLLIVFSTIGLLMSRASCVSSENFGIVGSKIRFARFHRDLEYWGYVRWSKVAS
jgi:hypothetical protein